MPWRERFARAVADGRIRPKPVQPRKIKRGLPGTRLKQLLTGLGIHPAAECKCKDRAIQMDAWGVAGCRQRKNEIVGWLTEQAGKWPFAKLGASALVSYAIFLAAKDEAE